MYAYIDESGNTGTNLFDSSQPMFLSLAMSSQVDFDLVFRDRLARIVTSTGLEKLHASELGVAGLESIARDLIELVEFSQVRFYFAYVQKTDVAVIKFYDAVFDPGENPAAPPLVYPIRGLRLLLLLKFNAILSVEETRLFWNAMISRPSESARNEAVSAIEGVLRRVWLLPDERSRQLIGDTLSWAKDNIQALSFWNQQKRDRYGHLPNLFTLPALMDGIDRSSKQWNSRIRGVVHDQQGQFGATLQHWFSFFRDREPERIVHFGDTPIQFGDFRESTFEIRDSTVSPGLQLVDVVLWAFSRMLSDRDLGPISTELFWRCFSPDDMFIMSLGNFASELEVTLPSLMAKPISEEELTRGQQMVDRAEALRQQRMTDDANKRF